MNKKNSVWTALPVLFGFFVMGFCDIVGISSDYAASAFGWSSTMAGLIPSVVFIWTTVRVSTALPSVLRWGAAPPPC